ncbi:D-isomer specific 2-hydroxyacid dehydrogenase [Xylariaceae sp. FL0804]|nr:D-isomer specific 2-hydroxyacid dehydrogenase [Xylariaceae sp. FL0804]
MLGDDLKRPGQLPSSTHEVVVLLEAVHLPPGDLDTSPRTHELIVYQSINRPDEIRERIQCASIVIAPQAHINAETLGEAPHLRCVITPTAGLNHIDVGECRRRGIRVARCPGSTSPAVAEQALSLYFAARRKTILLHASIRSVDESQTNEWKQKGSVAYKMQTANGRAPPSIEEEVVGIIGYGNIGKRLALFCRALGMEVLISERVTGGRHQPGSAQVRAGARDTSATGDDDPPCVRVPFDRVVRSVSVLFVCCTMTEDSRNAISTPELAAMRPEAVIVNVSRGGVVDTAAVVRALREKRISGAAVDVFDREPATTVEDSAFLAKDTEELNLTLSPHVGYFSTKTIMMMKAMVKERIKDFVCGRYDKFEP